jgi:hypothetical protein
MGDDFNAPRLRPCATRGKREKQCESTHSIS